MVSVSVVVTAGLPLSGRAVRRAWDSFVRHARVILSQDTAERFETATAPDGQPWEPLKSTTRRKAVQAAIAKVGGRAAQPIVQRTASGGLIVRARRPLPNYQRTARVRRTNASRILVDTGRLRASVVVNAASADAIRHRYGFVLEWGTRVPYALSHQVGDPNRNLPTRPFLGVSNAARQRMERTLLQLVQAQMR